MSLYKNGPVGGYVGWTNGVGYIDFHTVDGETHRLDVVSEVVTVLP